MQSLTVFDPKKVFTEVIKPNHIVLQCGGAFYNLPGTGLVFANGKDRKHT